MDMKLEVVVLPVSDVDRAKKFYSSLGWRMDGDFDLGGGKRGVQMTPPSSRCSVIFGSGITTATPGSTKELYLAVSDIEAARAELTAKGVKVTETCHGFGDWSPGRDPERRSYQSFARFSDPDGNGWVLQELTTRRPGRADGETEFHSEDALAGAMKRAELAHGAHEKTLGHRDEEWPAWYAKYMTSEQAGRPLPQ